MATYRLSRAAETDIEGIYYTGVLAFGLRQADTYYDGLVARFERIVEAS